MNYDLDVFTEGDLVFCRDNECDDWEEGVYKEFSPENIAYKHEIIFGDNCCGILFKQCKFQDEELNIKHKIGWYKVKNEDRYISVENVMNQFGQTTTVTEIIHDPVPNNVGDIDSNEVGSGARYNSGKMDASYLTPSFVASTLKSKHYGLIMCLKSLDVFYTTGHKDYLLDSIKVCMNEIWITLGCEKYPEELVCDVFEFGAKKYKKNNWMKGMHWSVPVACILRHSLDIAKGEDVDSESGLHHLGHIACNLQMLLHFNTYFPQLNDLPFKDIDVTL